MIKRYGVEPRHVDFIESKKGSVVFYEDHIAELESLRAKLEACEKDAQRYQAVRESGKLAASKAGNDFCMPMYPMSEEHKIKLDEICDAIAAQGGNKG